MDTRRTTSGLLLLIVLAFAGLLLVVVPQKLVSQYEMVRRMNPSWSR